MNTNDLPPAARLAALIEAGRAANPDLKHGRGAWYVPENREACALGFAGLALGVPRDVMADSARNYRAVGNALGVEPSDMIWTRTTLYGVVQRKNDAGATLDEIITSLREGELAKVPA